MSADHRLTVSIFSWVGLRGCFLSVLDGFSVSSHCCSEQEVTPLILCLTVCSVLGKLTVVFVIGILNPRMSMKMPWLDDDASYINNNDVKLIL